MLKNILACFSPEKIIKKQISFPIYLCFGILYISYKYLSFNLHDYWLQIICPEIGFCRYNLFLVNLLYIFEKNIFLFFIKKAAVGFMSTLVSD